jgi:AAA+ superfamily predicted ATPase
MVQMHLVSTDGEPLGALQAGADEIIAEADRHARDNAMSKRRCFPLILRRHVEAAGCTIAEADLADALAKVECVRGGDQSSPIRLRVSAADRGAEKHQRGDMSAKTNPAGRFFEAERVYPNPEARAWYDRLVGIDEHKRRLLLELELLLYPERLARWSREHHGRDIEACRIMASRAPLVLLEGDVGCGKTVLAETVGDPLAERAGGKVHLLKVNTQVRGTGMVGEMTDLIVHAFTHAEQRADTMKGQPLLFLIDEADALAAKRVDQHMHHEDKAGLNTLLQRIDGLRLGGRRIAVIFITNRPDALDPAIRRRAALHLTFGRPDDDQRAELLRRSIPELELNAKDLRELVAATGANSEKRYGATFTWSDITDRLIPAAVREAYAARHPLAAVDLIAHAREMEPTPLMQGGEVDGRRRVLHLSRRRDLRSDPRRLQHARPGRVRGRPR